MILLHLETIESIWGAHVSFVSKINPRNLMLGRKVISSPSMDSFVLMFFFIGKNNSMRFTRIDLEAPLRAPALDLE